MWLFLPWTLEAKDIGFTLPRNVKYGVHPIHSSWVVMPQHTALDLGMLYQFCNPGAPSRSTFQHRMKKSLSMQAVGKHSQSNYAPSRKRNTLALARTLQFVVHPSFYLITWKWLLEWLVDWYIGVLGCTDHTITTTHGCSEEKLSSGVQHTSNGMRLMCLIGYATRSQCGMISKSKTYS